MLRLLCMAWCPISDWRLTCLPLMAENISSKKLGKMLQCACNLCLFLPAGELDSQMGQYTQDLLDTMKQTLDEQVSKTICSLHHNMTASSGCHVKLLSSSVTLAPITAVSLDRPPPLPDSCIFPVWFELLCFHNMLFVLLSQQLVLCLCCCPVALSWTKVDTRWLPRRPQAMSQRPLSPPLTKGRRPMVTPTKLQRLAVSLHRMISRATRQLGSSPGLRQMAMARVNFSSLLHFNLPSTRRSR